MKEPTVTILIPNYKTLHLTKLCLRLLRMHTDPQKIKVIVIDNDSNDESLEYLRGLNWIELIERKKQQDDTPALSHSRALDLALGKVTTPYVLSIHTDTLIKRSDAIDLLLSEIRANPTIGGVGSWKLESAPSIGKRLWKSVEYRYRGIRYRLKGDIEKSFRLEQQQGSGYYQLFGKEATMLTNKDYYYLRSHCALYRMDLIRKYKLSFGPETAGKAIYKKLTDEGYRMMFLSSDFLSRYIVHINHATMALHPELGSGRKNITKGRGRIKKELKKIGAERILADETLDRL
jgi:GT2 family glycosyltransferase